ncbi:VOC family protein [Massilia sp. Dwa41.01b]|uniref:VOC family protein n=1 Tax=unclassified Massilia TaxID=2609279 RepID=UPI0015FFE9C8|nr:MULTISPECIES: VOC family protein [unclassified Massilia]QNA89916.1 VOC family protein [Massilia sp. Dwa41.01b]QNB00801.1 VOC family protein [Massilia sp. Se16.2.3]
MELDHAIVPARDRVAAARQLAHLLGVPWEESAFGVFSPVYINAGLTLDFIQTSEPFPVEHFCFRVSDDEFDAIFKRIVEAGISYRSHVRGPVNQQVNTDYGGRGIYWNLPEGHQWELLTVSYARQMNKNFS